MEHIEIQPKKNVFEEIDKLGPNPNNFWQIDFLKVWMMALVILDHSIPHIIMRLFHALAWERIAIPVFMVVLGFNWTKSMKRLEDQSLKSLYSWERYFKPKIQRFVVPFAIIYGLSLIYLILANVFIGSDFLSIIYYHPFNFPVPELHEPILKIFLMLPIWGPGNWFIPMLFLTILIFPLLYKLFSITPLFTLILCYIIEIGFQFSIRLFINANGVDYRINIFTFMPFMLMSAIGLGMWLARDHRWDAIQNIIVWVLGLASFAFVIYAIYFGWPVFAFWTVFDYNLFVYPYSALIVMLTLNIFPKSPSGPQYRFITTLSKSTYHILTTQIFYFSLIYGLLLPFNAPFGTISYPISFSQLNLQHVNYLWFYPVNLVITFTIGTLWQLVGTRFWNSHTKTRQRINQKRLEMMKSRGWIKPKEKTNS
ncbi:MAG: acyltransferase family protein [Candidatus Lokiarchaeota archaeon]|nr:acyltransferase family protein [Candidatus Lokiarchaeota archaeon]